MTDEEKQSNKEKQPKERKKRKGKPRAHGTGGLFYREDRKEWVAQIALGNGKIKQVYRKKQEDAAEILNQMLYEYRRGTLVTEKDQTVKQHFEHWLEVHKSKVRLSTYLQYCRHVKKHILPMLGHLSLQRLAARDIDTLYARKLEEGLSPSSIGDIHMIIHMALKQAVRWQLVARNVSDDVTPPRETRPNRRQALTPQQAQQLLEAARGHRLEAMITLALATGMRRGELLALRWQDIDFQQKCLYVRRSVSRLPGEYRETDPKTASGKRRITLPQFVIEALQRHGIRQVEAKLKAGPAWEEHDLVFCNISGRFLNTQSLFVLFSSLLQKAGLPHMRFHDLRHSAATILLSMGVPAKVVQELLGHSHISMTLNVYGHVLPSMQQEAMDKLNDWFSQQDDQGSKQGGADKEAKKEKAPAFLVEVEGELATSEKYTDIKIYPASPDHVLEQMKVLDQKLKKFGVYVLQTFDGERYDYRPDSQGQYTVRVLEPDTFTIMQTQTIIIRSNFVVISQETTG